MPRGRPTRLNPQVADTIVAAVRSGAPLEVAARVAGIPPGTFHEWMERGEGRGDRPRRAIYAEFAERVRRAEAEAHILTVGVIRSAITSGSWEAARAWLRMRWPKYYAERAEVTGPEGGAVAVEIAGMLEGMSDDDLRRLLGRLRSLSRDRGGDRETGEEETV